MERVIAQMRRMSYGLAPDDEGVNDVAGPRLWFEAPPETCTNCLVRPLSQRYQEGSVRRIQGARCSP